MLVTAQDFKVKPYKIPNLDDPETLADFVSIATREEEDVLNRILGPNLYSDVLAGLEEDPVLAIYTNLVSGVEYEYVNRKYKFIGLKAILKPWIFAQWIRNNYREFTGAGVAIPALENAQILNPGQMIYDAESDFVNLVGGKAYHSQKYLFPLNDLYGFLNVHLLDYPSLNIAHFRRFEISNPMNL